VEREHQLVKESYEMTTLLVRRSPLGALRPRRELRAAEARLSVPLNIAEDAEGYTLTALLPGLTPEMIDLHLSDRTLTIGGELQLPEPAEGARYRLRELSGGRFERSVSFAYPLDGGAVTASYSNGMLTLRLPKAESAKARRISVEEAGVLQQ
jgi:HSP20 family protein